VTDVAEQQRRTLTPRERSRAVLAAMESLDPVVGSLSDETRIQILKDLQAEYIAARANGSKSGAPKRKP